MTNKRLFNLATIAVLVVPICCGLLVVLVAVLYSITPRQTTRAPAPLVNIPASPTAIPTPPTYLILDGYDADGSIITRINIWKDYNNRTVGIAAVGEHGQTVKLIRRDSDAVQIETLQGARGWVTYWFIREYKVGLFTQPLPMTSPATQIAPTASTPNRVCCKICSAGKACGDTCISKDKPCDQPPGCACD